MEIKENLLVTGCFQKYVLSPHGNIPYAKIKQTVPFLLCFLSFLFIFASSKYLQHRVLYTLWKRSLEHLKNLPKYFFLAKTLEGVKR